MNRYYEHLNDLSFSHACLVADQSATQPQLPHIRAL